MDSKEVKETFKKRRKNQIIVSIIVFPIIITIILLSEHWESDLLGFSSEMIIVGIIPIMIFLLIFSFRNWRCPSCNKYLGKGINPKYCSKCGVGLK